MLAALEVPDVPSDVRLSTCAAAALQGVVSKGRARIAQATCVEPVPTPTVSDVWEVLQAFYQDAYAQHLKQDWLVKQGQPIASKQGHRRVGDLSRPEPSKAMLLLHSLPQELSDNVPPTVMPVLHSLAPQQHHRVTQ